MVTRTWGPEIHALYDSVGDDARFVASFAGLRQAIQARTMVLVSAPAHPNDTLRHIAAVGVPDESLIAYEHHFHHHDVWMEAGRHQGLLAPGAVSYSDQLIAQSELERSYFWQAFLQRYGTTDALSAVIELPPHAPAMTFITFHRGPGDPRFSDAEARQLRAWLPHIATVVRQHRRLAPELSRGRSLDALFRRCQQGMFVLDATGRVVDGNPAFRRWLRERTPFAPDIEAGRLFSQANVREWLQGQDECFTLTAGTAGRRDAARIVLSRIYPSFAASADNDGCAAVGLVEALTHADALPMARRFDLTEAQARVADCLVRGLRPGTVADDLGLSVHTVRTHVRALFDKTGTANLTALVARLLS